MLTVHRASSGEVLAQALAQVLAGPPDDPFTSEIVAVPAKGVERWLAQRLSHTLGAVAGDGVCANVDFPWPSTVLDDALQSALQAAAPEHAGAVEQWAPQRMLWPLIEVTDESLSQPWLRTLAHHLGSWNADSTLDTDKGRRVATLTRLARLYDDYGQARPEMLQAWAGRRDESGDGTALPRDLRWQAELWRRLRERIGLPSPAELLDDACQRLADDPAVSALPARLSVFGASRLAPARLRVLAALAEHRDVHLWLHHPSPALWDATADQATADQATTDQSGPAVRRADDTVRASLRNPLLASMSRDLLELQLLLRRHAPASAGVHHRQPPRPHTLLGHLQDDLATDADGVRPDRTLAAGDRTVQVHSCHGRTRQVEVLREVVLGLLRDDPTLEPRDILVMCPDVEAFAPLVAAAFSLGAEDDEGHPAARLRVRLADRSLQQTNALLDVLSQILSLGTARISAPEVLDLAGLSAVRRRFGVDEDALERLREWVAGAGVRWGLDAPHRAEWQLSGISQGTWRSGLDRLMLGVAMEGESTIVSDVVPMGDVDSSDIELAGRLAELVDRLDAAQTLMSGRHTVGEWMTGLENATLGLAECGTANAWQQTQLRSVLADALDDAGDSGCELGLADVRSLLNGMLAGRPSRSSFRTGTLTVCTLVPMRSVPHRVICLLGLDDGTFPRQSIRDGDDVLARDPWIGERDPRSEDRQLLLDAVCAAGEHLVITYSGADERTGASIPPAVPLGELLDALDRTASAGSGGQRVRDVITTQHPLQPFDARNFTGGDLGVPGPFSFDRAGLEGAIAARGTRTTPGAFLPAQLGALPPASIELADLTRLLLHPAKGFLRQRLDVGVTRADEDPDDKLPVEYDNLESWALGDRLLSRRLADISPMDCIRLEQLGGLLPPGPLGNELLRKVGMEVDTVVRACANERRAPAESRDVDVQLPAGTRLAGTVRNVRADVVLSVTYSKVSAKQRLSAWINLVALAATDDSRSWSAIVVGRDPGRGRTGSLCKILGPISAHDARQTVAELAGLYRAGLRSPLPIPLKSAAAYAAPRARGSRVVASRTAASNEWCSDRFEKEDADQENVLVYGRGAPFSVLTQEPPQPGEAAWFPDEEDRFGVLSRRLWNRLLAAEREERR